jgi:glutamate N-acetyltransferase/amino-acid N-acetyltransferase
VILPLGFRYAATHARIRKDPRDDLALILSDRPAAAAAVFTANRVQAAPVKLARAHLKASRGAARAVLVNAGNANCATRTGDAVALETCRALASKLRVPLQQIIPASTGVIGVELDARKITRALPRLVRSLHPDGFLRAAQAILTTDRVPKTAHGEVACARGLVRLAAMTKGAGMIHPRMATTLGFLVTDAAVSPRDLKPMLEAACERSYNRLSVDGDMSTNDIFLVLANGASGVRLSGDDLGLFQLTLTKLMQELAAQIARDGEGAAKRITIQVSGARTEADAVRIARAIANSPLVKTAVAGADPNWGRILSAAGAAGVPFDPAKADIALQGALVCEGGLAASFAERALKRKLKTSDCYIEFRLRGSGRGRARFWTCDLTEDYIRINASYRT